MKDKPELIPVLVAVGHFVQLGARPLELQLEFMNELVVLGTLLLCPREFGLHRRELRLLLLKDKPELIPGLVAVGHFIQLGARPLELQPELMNELFVLGTLLLYTGEFGLRGRELRLSSLEDTLEFIPGLFALDGFVMLATCLLEFLSKLLHERVVLGTLLLCPRKFCLVLLKGALEFPGG